ncbi:MAG: YmdB family metallophosphoesterase [Planctomycetota bacterium]|nr:MAG: YmdB family metallophosphoesterase [Planctomycetota bacterium]
MELTLLCVGDVVGAPGRRVLREALEHWKRDGGLDAVIVNAENAAGGSGITPALFEKIRHYGADVVTLGDHLYRRKEAINLLETSDRIVKPANLPPSAPGKTFAVFETASNHRVAVVSLLGRLFMKPPGDCPFAAVDRVLGAIPDDVKIIVVDMHAEATSEKVAMGWYLDGRVSVLFGTHTHVPTADARILPKGTAYVTDLGMTGPYDSVLGRDKHRVLTAMRTAVPAPFDVADGDVRLSGLRVRVDTTTGRATHVQRACFPEGAGR